MIGGDLDRFPDSIDVLEEVGFGFLGIEYDALEDVVNLVSIVAAYCRRSAVEALAGEMLETGIVDVALAHLLSYFEESPVERPPFQSRFADAFQGGTVLVPADSCQGLVSLFDLAEGLSDLSLFGVVFRSIDALQLEIQAAEA